MEDSIQTRGQATAVVDGVAGDGLAENTWPWFMGFCGMLLIFVYREALRLMFWARSLNY